MSVSNILSFVLFVTGVSGSILWFVLSVTSRVRIQSPMICIVCDWPCQGQISYDLYCLWLAVSGSNLLFFTVCDWPCQGQISYDLYCLWLAMSGSNILWFVLSVTSHVRIQYPVICIVCDWPCQGQISCHLYCLWLAMPVSEVWTLAIAPLTWVRLVTSSALQSRKWQLIGMSQ